MNNPIENPLVSPTAMLDQNCPTERLCQKVMWKIEQREIARARYRSSGFGLIVIAAIVAFIPAIKYLVNSASTSGFGQYFSLFISDGSYAMSNWKNIAMSITEALPITAIMAIVALLLICLSSIRSFMKYRSEVNAHQFAMRRTGLLSQAS